MDNLINSIEEINSADNKLILVVGKPGSGKSKVVKEYSANTGIPILDFSKVLNNNTDDLRETMKAFLKSYRFDVLLLDNKTAFYKNNSDVDLMELLKEISKEIVVVATWNGYVDGGSLVHIVGGKESSYPLDGTYKYILV